MVINYYNCSFLFLFQLIAVIQDLHFMVARLSQMEVVDFLWELWSLFTAIPTIH